MPKTRKNSNSNIPWKNWSKEAPNFHQRTVMLKKCGRKCFLGPKKTFPICKKNTCKISKKGVYAAYIRARQYKHAKISKRAKKLLTNLTKL